MNQKNKTFASVRTKAVEVADEQWQKIQSFMVAPDSFEKQDVRVFEAYLAHNFIDRDKERFSKPTLQALADTIVGKQVLMHHDKWSNGVGRFIDSQLQKMSMDETLQLVGAHPDKKLREKLARIEQADGGLYWMAVQYYMLASNPRVPEIEAGIIGDMSISFKFAKLKEVRVDEKDQDPIWLEYQETEEEGSEAVEGSLVFLGAQNGARVRKRKGADGKEIETDEEWEELLVSLSGLDPKEIKQFIVDQSKKTKGTEMITLKMLGAEHIVEADKAETIEAVETAVANAIKALTDEKDALAGKVAEIEAERDAVKAECDNMKTTQESAAKVLADVKDYRDALVAEAVKIGCLVDLIAQDQVEAKKAAFEALPIPELKEKINEYKTVFAKLYPEKSIIDTPKPKVEPKNVNHYIAPTI